MGMMGMEAGAGAGAGAASPVFSYTHSRNNSNSNSHGNDGSSPIIATAPNTAPLPGTGTGGMGMMGGGGGGGLSARPSITIPRMPFQPYPFRTKSLAALSASYGSSNPYSSNPYTPSHYPVPAPSTPTGPPTLYLHHSFSLRRILAVFLLTLFLAVFTTVMWILFGLPGRGADQGDGMVDVQGKEYPLSGKRDAQGRVLVGIVLGIVVGATGVVGEAGWVWGSWVLI